MEIVIESPLGDLEPRRIVRPIVSGNSGISSSLPPPPPPPEYFSSLGNKRSMVSGSSDGVSGTPVRRVDRSGLLEMPLRDPGVVAPRRIDRSGLLESVSEIPDHVAYAKSRLEGTTNTSLTLPRVRCRDRRVSNEPKEAPASLSINDIKRLSPILNSADQINERREKQNLRVCNSPRNRGPPSTAGLSIPDVIEAHEIPTTNSRRDDQNYDNNDNDPPEGERVEAEGCEHTAIESLEEARVAFKGAKKMTKKNNDGIQTLRVIILSEQL